MENLSQPQLQQPLQQTLQQLEPTVPEFAAPEPATSESASPVSVAPEQAAPEFAALEPAAPDPTAPEPAASELPKPTLADLFTVLALIVFGFCFWDWGYECWLLGYGIGTTGLFLSVLVIGFFYMLAKGIRQNAKSLVMLAAALVGSLPFFLNGSRDINLLLILFEATLCLLWIMYSCRTSVSEKLTILIAGDFINQVLIVPFANFSRFFTRPFKLSKTGGKAWRPVLFAILGLIVCMPIFAIVSALLISADDGFSMFVDGLDDFFKNLNLARYTFQFIFGLPVAAYVFGAVFGNVFRRHTDKIDGRRCLNGFERAHVLHRAAIYLPLVLFILLYIIFFIAMGSYLFSGLQGKLPVNYDVVEYARQGFFQLCEVASINLAILGLIWLLAKRNPREYPLALRVLSSLLTLLTCLLIVTAASKMLLYIQTYELTPLRVYTSWFMLLMFIVFVLLVVWHIKPFNAARPIMILILIFTLILGVTNTNAIIADYNVDRHLAGKATVLELPLLEELGDSALPALYKLEQHDTDSNIRELAAGIIERNHQAFEAAREDADDGLTTRGAWQITSLPSLRADELYARR
jgi:hypothetical protein